MTEEKERYELSQQILLRRLDYAEHLLIILANKTGIGFLKWCKWCENESSDHHPQCALKNYLSTGEMIDLDELDEPEI